MLLKRKLDEVLGILKRF